MPRKSLAAALLLAAGVITAPVAVADPGTGADGAPGAANTTNSNVSGTRDAVRNRLNITQQIWGRLADLRR